MKYKKSNVDNSEIHGELKELFDKAQTPVIDVREQCLEDRRFYSISGAQWEGQLGEQFENSPQMEFNEVHLAVLRIINEHRNNPITVDFVSDSNDKLADVCDKIFRANEYDSNAKEAYNSAFEEAVGGGFGAWRITTEYEDEEDEENDTQVIKILPIYDADSCVFFDPNAQRQDKADAKYCFVLKGLTKEAYSEEYGQEPATMGNNIEQSEFDWYTKDIVYIAEVFKCEYKNKTIEIYENPMGEEKRISKDELEENEELLNEILASGYTFVRSKKVKKKRIRKYIMDGAKILEDCGYIAGKHIPIVPVYGKRWFVDNIERCMGHVRLAKDAQRLINMTISRLAEMSAYSSITKPIFTPEQVQGHSIAWEEANIKNYAYLLLNPVQNADGTSQPLPPISYTQQPQIPPALAGTMDFVMPQISKLLGNQQAGEELRSNISGDLMEMIHSKLDMQTYIYMDNMALAMQRSGVIWLSMAKEILVEENRKVKGIDKNNNIEYIELSKQELNEFGGVSYANDITKANLDIKSTVAPATSTRKAKTVRDLLSMTQMVQDPQIQQVLSSVAVLNMEGEGIDDVRKFMRGKLVRMGAITPTEQEQQELQQEMQTQQPTAQDIYLQSEAQKNQAQAQKAQADTAKTIAETEQTQAETMEIFANMDLEQQKATFQALEKLMQMQQV